MDEFVWQEDAINDAFGLLEFRLGIRNNHNNNTVLITGGSWRANHQLGVPLSSLSWQL